MCDREYMDSSILQGSEGGPGTIKLAKGKEIANVYCALLCARHLDAHYLIKQPSRQE